MNRILALPFILAAAGPAHAKTHSGSAYTPEAVHRREVARKVIKEMRAFELPKPDELLYAERAKLELKNGTKVVVDSEWVSQYPNAGFGTLLHVFGKENGGAGKMATLNARERAEVLQMVSPKIVDKSHVRFESPVLGFQVLGQEYRRKYFAIRNSETREGRNEMALDALTRK